MSVLNELFSHIADSEVIPLFDEMESKLQSLMANYALDVNEKVSDEELYHLLGELQRKWDENFFQWEREWDTYFSLSKEIYQRLEKSHFNWNDVENAEKRRRIFGELELLRLWAYETDRPSLLGILYHSQRMNQLRDDVELYQKDATKEMLTLRHLFEQGLKRMNVEADRYIEISKEHLREGE